MIDPRIVAALKAILGIIGVLMISTQSTTAKAAMMIALQAVNDLESPPDELPFGRGGAA